MAVQGKLQDKLAPPPARQAQGLTSLSAGAPRGRQQDVCVFLKVGSNPAKRAAGFGGRLNDASLCGHPSRAQNRAHRLRWNRTASVTTSTSGHRDWQVTVVGGRALVGELADERTTSSALYNFSVDLQFNSQVMVFWDGCRLLLTQSKGLLMLKDRTPQAKRTGKSPRSRG